MLAVDKAATIRDDISDGLLLQAIFSTHSSILKGAVTGMGETAFESLLDDAFSVSD